MDPSLLAMLFGSTGLPNIQAGIEPNSWIPPQPSPAPVPAPPMPTPVGPQAGPPAPFPPMQGFEATNTMNPRPPMPQEAYRSEPYMPPPAQTLGAALEPAGAGGVPLPRPRPAEAPGATTPQGGGSDALLRSLRGVQAPAAPTPQRVSTPHLPALRPIQGGGYMDLLAALGVGPQQALPGLKLPSTLGQALGGR